MPPYNWIHLENVWWVLAGGLLVAVAIILIRGSGRLSFSTRQRSDEQLEQVHDFGDTKETDRPVPLFIWLVFGGWLVWAVAYALFSGTHGL